MIREYALGVEQAGFHHLSVYDHILGADPVREGWSGPYTNSDPFHEVFVLLGFLAAFTSRIELVTEILVLPQRQTALAAKQAAEVDLLSGGRLRLGVGVGWNAVEFEALGATFHDRGRRMDEQIQLLRQLWSSELVEFAGEHHKISRAGLNPLPGRTIPIWIGATADPGLLRAARLADGWMSEYPIGPKAENALRRIRESLLVNDRDPAKFGVSGEITLKPHQMRAALEEAHAWQALGATHLSLTTMGATLRNVEEHLELLLAFKQAWSP